jgi:hypothetical protein
MKRLLLIVIFSFSASLSFGQKGLLSYDDLKYLVHNNIQKADTFLMAKGYVIAKKNNDTKNRKYTLANPGNTYKNVSIRVDGKKLFIEIESNDIEQYNLIHDSIIQYIDKNSTAVDVQTYVVKDLGTIYIALDDPKPDDPIKRDYDIHIIADKQITAYD